MFYIETKTGEKLDFKQAWPKIIARIFNCFLDFELLLLNWVGYLPFHSLRNFCYRLSGIKIGRGSTIHMWARFYQPRNISIGQDTIIGDHCFLDGRAPLRIGNHVAIASQVLIYNSEHDVNSPDFLPTEEAVNIDDYCFIGARAIILPGVKIAKGAVVAAGAVVTKDVSPLLIVGGVPARQIGERKVKKLDYKLGRARLFQ
ncbi:MAG TPA: acyltransferase [Candidatus Bathyarchaeia archaeon]|nr:acyltransferase [Candidatus Bathyarchaeia archaeon]